MIAFPRSLPTRERGLKQLRRGARVFGQGVAPYAGAWIETILSNLVLAYGKSSLPTRERGLKPPPTPPPEPLKPVAPYAGAWIETHQTLTQLT